MPRSQSAAYRCCHTSMLMGKRRASITENVVSLPCSSLYWAALLNIQSHHLPDWIKLSLQRLQLLILRCHPEEILGTSSSWFRAAAHWACTKKPHITSQPRWNKTHVVVCEFTQMNHVTHCSVRGPRLPVQTSVTLEWFFERLWSAEGLLNPQFTPVTRALQQNFCRLPEYLRCSSHQ